MVGDPLNPEAHRAAIVAIDAILFEDGPLAPGDRDVVKSHLLALSKVAAADPKNTIAVRLGKDLRTLAANLEAVSTTRPLVNSPLRQHWLRLRGSLFDDAWWFRRRSADPIATVEPEPPRPSPLRTATAEERAGLDAALSAIERLSERATSDLPNSYDSEPHRQFVTWAEGELSRAVDRLGPPLPPYGIDSSYRDAHRSGTEAARVMNVLLGLGVGAPASSREYLIDKINEHARRARTALASMR